LKNTPAIFPKNRYKKNEHLDNPMLNIINCYSKNKNYKKIAYTKVKVKGSYPYKNDVSEGD